MNIAVYAICKNEAQFAQRWAESMSEADSITVLDTGSTDGSPELLTALGCRVFQETIAPWRFDTARNRALDLVPQEADICVATDLDEVFHPGWRSVLENAWLPWADQACYRYTWSFTPEGEEELVFQKEKIHTRKNFRWKHPVHEVLTYTAPGEPVVLYLPQIQLDHHPDPNKSRGQYLPLLELAVAEAPEDDRCRHYLGREYFFHRRYAEAIETLQTHLALSSATWADERAAGMLYIARSYQAMGNGTQAQRWYELACTEAPWLREMWLGRAEFAYSRADWTEVLYCCSKALSITHRPLTYLSDSRCWGSLPYDLGAIAAWYLGQKDLAMTWGQRAVLAEPQSSRLQENLRFYQNMQR